MFNVPPLLVGMMLVSWLEWFARANAYDSFHAFRKDYFFNTGSRCFRMSFGKSLLCPYIFGLDAAIDFALNLLCSASSSISIRQVIRQSTIFLVVTSFYSSAEKQKFASIENTKAPIICEDIIREYNQFRLFQGTDFILSTKSNFLYGLKVQSPSVLRYCPKCVKRDFSIYGFACAYTWHNFPGVCTCPEHGCDLVIYSDGIPCNDSKFELVNPCAGPENVQYSSFVFDFFNYFINNSPNTDITFLTNAVYTFQEYAHVSSWRILNSIMYEGYIDSSFPGLDVRSKSKVFSDQYYKDESFNYFMYEPQNLFCILVYLFGKFTNLIPFLENKNYVPSNSVIDDFYKRHGSNYSLSELRSMNKETLNKLIAEKTDGNCTIKHIDQDICYIRCKEIPPCIQFTHLISTESRAQLIKVPLEDVFSDLAQSRTYMFLPVFESSIKYFPPAEKKKQEKAFKKHCEAYLLSFMESERIKLDVRAAISTLPLNSFGLLNKKECLEIFRKAIKENKETECYTDKESLYYKKRARKT